MDFVNRRARRPTAYEQPKSWRLQRRAARHQPAMRLRLRHRRKPHQYRRAEAQARTDGGNGPPDLGLVVVLHALGARRGRRSYSACSSASSGLLFFHRDGGWRSVCKSGAVHWDRKYGPIRASEQSSLGRCASCGHGRFILGASTWRGTPAWAAAWPRRPALRSPAGKRWQVGPQEAVARIASKAATATIETNPQLVALERVIIILDGSASVSRRADIVP